jgi:UDP-2,4-diacetamido-2,4,6-trideoxy-beta-L-altropyranose hydrolase
MNTGTPWFAFRVDASPEMGIGHLMRCLTLAVKIRELGFDVYFICRQISSELVADIEGKNINVIRLPSAQPNSTKEEYLHSSWLGVSQAQDAEDTLSFLRSNSHQRRRRPKMIVVDHYAIAAPWEKIISHLCPVFAFDDLNDRAHHVDLLLDPTIGKVSSAYNGLVPRDTRLFIGPKFALLRDEFITARERVVRKPKDANKPWRILVTLGGADPDNKTLLVLRSLLLLNGRFDFEIVVLAGTLNLNLDNLISFVDKSSMKVQVIQYTKKISELMVHSDICIGAAGSTSWERCALGLPTINITLADNQKAIAANLHRVGASLSFGSLTETNFSKLSEEIEALFSRPERLSRMSEIAMTVCDGYGVNRVIKEILDNP